MLDRSRSALHYSWQLLPTNKRPTTVKPARRPAEQTTHKTGISLCRHSNYTHNSQVLCLYQPQNSTLMEKQCVFSAGIGPSQPKLPSPHYVGKLFWSQTYSRTHIPFLTGHVVLLH